MSTEKTYNYTAADIEKYHKGLLSPKERHALEKAALDDPFLADALEGYTGTPVNMQADIAELNKRLEDRLTEKTKVVTMPAGNSFKWWRAAAAAILIGGVGFGIYKLTGNGKNEPVAKNETQPVTIEKKKDTVDTNFVSPAATNKDSNNTETNTVSDLAGKSTASNSETKSVQQPAVASGDVTVSAISTDTTYKKLDDKDEQSKEALAIKKDEYYKKDVADKKVATRQAEFKAQTNNANDVASAAPNSPKAKQQQPALNYFRGQVLDDEKNPLPFANITNTKDNVGTYADAKGNFTLVSTDTALTVQIRSVGFQNQNTLLRKNLPNNKVVLQEEKSTAQVLQNNNVNANNRSRSLAKVEEPEPADGWMNYDTYLVNNLNVPQDNNNRKPSGYVQLSFEVNKEGEPVNITVDKSLSSSCDEEAIRLVKEGPKWKKKSKKAKRVTVTIPFDQQ